MVMREENVGRGLHPFLEVAVVNVNEREERRELYTHSSRWLRLL